jgi:hypothetical protein
MRPCLAEPPAESPSTRNSSDLAGSRSWSNRQACPGSDATSERALAPGQFTGLACRFPRRGRFDHLADKNLVFAGAGFSSSHSLKVELIRFSTTGRTSEETSLSLVCEENFGSGTLTDKDACQALAAIIAGQRDLFLLVISRSIRRSQ